MKRTVAALAAGTGLALVLTFGIFEIYPPSRVTEIRNAMHAVAQACADPSRAVDVSPAVDALIGALQDAPGQPIPLYGAGGVMPVRHAVAVSERALAQPTTRGSRPGATLVPATAPCVRSTRGEARRLRAALAASGPG